MPRTAAFRAHAAAAAKIEQRDADRLALEIDPSIADEIDALDDETAAEPECEACSNYLRQAEIDAGHGLCVGCLAATLGDERGDDD